MSEDTKKYFEELAQNFIELTLDVNHYERILKDIKEVVESRCKSETKIKKIKLIIGELNENTEGE